MELFNFELKENTEPQDDTRLTYLQFYMSAEDKVRFNRLCKAGMLKYYGSKAKEANAVDFILELLEHNFGAQKEIPFE